MVDAQRRVTCHVICMTGRPVIWLALGLQYIQTLECDCEATMSAYDASARLFKALMHPTRLEILDLLRDGEACVCHLEAALDLRQAYISQQLSVLREAGLVQDRRDGWNSYYRVTQPQVFALLDVAQTMSGVNPATARQQLSAKLSQCDCPRCAPEPVAA